MMDGAPRGRGSGGRRGPGNMGGPGGNDNMGGGREGGDDNMGGRGGRNGRRLEYDDFVEWLMSEDHMDMGKGSGMKMMEVLMMEMYGKDKEDMTETELM